MVINGPWEIMGLHHSYTKIIWSVVNMDKDLSPKAVSQQAELLKTSFQIVRRLERKVK